MQPFAQKARADFNELETLGKEAATAYSELLVYFSEDPKLPADEFFKVWANFVTAFDKAREDIKKAEEGKANAEKKAKLAAEKKVKGGR